MKVKAKWAIKVDGKWRKTGEVFQTEDVAALGNAVEILTENPVPEQVRMDDVKAETPEAPEAKAEAKPRAAARTRRKIEK
jgi:hypothetical protein